MKLKKAKKSFNPQFLTKESCVSHKDECNSDDSNKMFLSEHKVYHVIHPAVVQIAITLCHFV